MARPWIPKRVLVTPAALAWPAGTAMVERAAALGSEVVRLKSDRLSGLPDTYRDSKTTMAVIVASPSRRRLQPIPPSADWRFDLAIYLFIVTFSFLFFNLLATNLIVLKKFKKKSY